MANVFIFADNASTTLAGAISPTATTLNVAPGTGAEFPTPGVGQQFALSLTDALTGQQNEIMYCTAIAGDVLTVTRAQEGTIAQSWLAGDIAENRWTAGQAASMVQQVALNPAVIVTASGVFAMTTVSGAIGLNRTVAVSTSSTTLPTGAFVGQEFEIEDLARNFNAHPVTVNYPAGQTGPGGEVSQVLNVNGQCAYFRYYGSNVWSFKS